jgi:endonuclease/exonuclease/phosphatase family metal-dependent hydrolase
MQRVRAHVARVLSLGILCAAGAHGDTGALFPAALPEECRIATFNVDNYLTMPRHAGGKQGISSGKPLGEREGVARTVEAIRPDLIAFQEIGTREEFRDLRRRLGKRGVEFPHDAFLEGADPTRHIALLSRFPIIADHSLPDVRIDAGGLPLHSPRGFLDVTVEPWPGHRVRVVCVHLKAKVEVPDYDATALREAEARALRRHLGSILSEDPETRLVVMGDFNDTRNSRTLREIERGDLGALPLTDDRGECWTEFWEWAGVYSRIDYILISKNLESDVDAAGSAVAGFPFWREAGDHRPLVVTLKPSSRTETPNPATK